MKFEITRGNHYFWGPDPPWQVERILEKDIRYLVACFRDKEDAKACIDIIRRSVEVEEREAAVHA